MALPPSGLICVDQDPARTNQALPMTCVVVRTLRLAKMTVPEELCFQESGRPEKAHRFP